METVKLNIEVKATQLEMVKSFLKNINGILTVEEARDEHLENFLEMEKEFLSGNLETVSEQDFKKKCRK